jgi:hypothetical protein
MVNDCEYGESPRKAITQLDKDLGAVRKAHQKLSADSYVCKQLWRIREWQRRVAHRVTEDGAFEV